jgi:hypothetical protein
MAYILKPNRTFVNPYDGSLITSAYMIFDDLGMNKRRRDIRFDVGVYFSRQARVDLRDPLQLIVVSVGDPDFTTYFAPDANTKIWQQIENYIEAVGLPGIVVADWRKDPVDEP